MDNGGPSGSGASAVAVIGMSGRFPGARNVAEFWNNLRDGRETIRVFSDEELIAAGESPDAVRDPAYVKACGYLDDIDRFDAAFFGLSPRDAAVFDPQHRFFLECSWEAFEDAGYVGGRIGGPVGVFAASGASEYFTHNLVTNQELLRSIGAWLLRHTGNDTSFLATRVSYELDLAGPSMSVQTACSSSLTAVHLACQSLLNGECDVALAGASTIYPEQSGYLYKPGEILSSDGHCRPFDSQANGTVMASATGCVVLKRLSDAVRDGDTIRAVIRGSAINNDGSDKVGYLAPSVGGQVKVISEALNVAGVAAKDISYVEAHGTGTLLGDPIEIAALAQAFGPDVAKQSCVIGSVKSNFGHAGEAAGICGLIKTICALEHRELPGTLHYRAPNEQADLPNTPFFVSATLRPWNVAAGRRRYAGVTGLGAGGTNVHIVLEEAPLRQRPAGQGADAQLILLSARSTTALDAASKNLAGYLRANGTQALDEVAFTLLAGRESFPFRRAFAATNGPAAVSLLETGDPRRVATGVAARERPALTFLFPGGGAQYAGMGAELYQQEPAYRAAIDACLAAVQPGLDVDLRALMFPLPEAVERASARMEAPSLALPALFATEYALAKLLESWGFVPTALIGHSAGEYAAACVSGVLSMQDATALVAKRGKLFEKVPRGAMLSIALPETELRARLGSELSLAAVNGASLCVASGPEAAITRLEQDLTAAQVEHTRVHIDVAAHSAMLEPILAEFESFCRSIVFRKPKIPFVSNLTGTWITDAEATDPGYWVRHLRNTVQFDKGIRTLLETGSRALLEVGPGRGLSGLSRQQSVKPAIVVNALRHPKEEASDVAVLTEALGKLWIAGCEIDPQRFKRGSQRRVPLPTYPFERQRYWIDKALAVAPAATLTHRPDISQWFYAPSFQRSVPSAPLAAEDLRKPWLVLTDGSSLARALVARLRKFGAAVATVEPAVRYRARDGLAFSIDPSSAGDYTALIRDLREKNALPAHVVHSWALAPRQMRITGTAADADLAAWERGVVRYHNSLLFLSQALAPEVESLRLTAIGTAIEALDGEHDVHPEKSALMGVCRVLPRELAQTSCSIVDVIVPSAGSASEARLADRLVTEVSSAKRDPVVILRENGRWAQGFEQMPLEPAKSARTWLRPDGAYLVTGGLGGIGLEVMEHLARHGQARLVAVGRSEMPEEKSWDRWLASNGELDETSRKIRKLRALRAMGAEVMLASADVTDRKAMARVVAKARQRFGKINGIFHCAGLLKDQLIALRPPTSNSPVLDVKAKGALVLQSLFVDGELDFLVLFSSVSSILGLPGQADYTAGNAVLDALAKARAARGCRTRTISIDWNAWRDVGMLAAPASSLPQTEPSPPDGNGVPLGECLRDDADQTIFRSALNPSKHWLLAEHVVRGGQAVMPGTGYLDLARAVLAHRPEDRPIEIRDLVFLEPFTVGPEETRSLTIKLSRKADHRFIAFGGSEDQPYATARVGYVDAPSAAPKSVPAIRQRCPSRTEVPKGQLQQHFMNFGPRWANISAIQLGQDEALLDLVLPEDYASDLVSCALHPALLDMATGAAQSLVPGFADRDDFYVPLSYGRVLVRRALPRKFSSHVRLRSADGKNAVFDVELIDENGDLLVSIERYVMRRIDKSAGATTAFSSVSSVALRDRQASAADVFRREGMTTTEGLDALDRMLTNDVSPQIIASTLDLKLWLSQLNAGDQEIRPAVDAKDSELLCTTSEVGDVNRVHPRDAVERELAAMWKEMLGVRQVSIHDDFFELGGQSLIAFRLCNRIRKRYGQELPLSMLFQAPSIAAVATLLRGPLEAPDLTAQTDGEIAAVSPRRDETTVVKSLSVGAISPALEQRALTELPSSERFRSLVKIATGGDRPALYCVHGAGGNVLNFRDLARGLSPDQPFFALQMRGIDGIARPHGTIEEMAEAYLSEIRERQPHGPYLLAGYSGGGIVAFEMAQRLAAMGEEVPLLVLYDTFHPQMPIRPVTLGQMFRRLRDDRLGYLKRVALARLDRLRAIRERKQIERSLRRNTKVPAELRDRQLTESFVRAAAKYRPKSWHGRTVLFRAETVNYVYGGGGASYGWESVVQGGLEIVEIPGNHDTLVLGANAQELTRHLNIALEEMCSGFRERSETVPNPVVKLTEVPEQPPALATNVRTFAQAALTRLSRRPVTQVHAALPEVVAHETAVQDVRFGGP